MRARVAYISSLGTTAILVAAALLLLAVVSAIVAFRGWPGSATGGAGVQSVTLAPHAPVRSATLVRHTTKVRAVKRAAAPAARSARARRVSTSGLVKQKGSGPRVVPGVVMVPVTSSPMQPGDSPRTSQPTEHAVSTPAPVPQRTLPDQPNGPVGGGLTIPVPVPVPVPAPQVPPPPDSPVTTMVGTLLSGGSPPPPLLDSVIDVLR